MSGSSNRWPWSRILMENTANICGALAHPGPSTGGKGLRWAAISPIPFNNEETRHRAVKKCTRSHSKLLQTSEFSNRLYPGPESWVTDSASVKAVAQKPFSGSFQ